VKIPMEQNTCEGKLNHYSVLSEKGVKKGLRLVRTNLYIIL